MAKRKGIENKDYIEAMRGLRGSSAASPHQDRRERRKRTRAAKREAARKDHD